MIAVPIGPRERRSSSPPPLPTSPFMGGRRHPSDLLDHVCIRHRFASGVIPTWEFERDGEVVKVAPQGRLIATSIELEVAAAVQGLGVIASFDGFLAPSIAEGLLEPVLEDWSAAIPGTVSLLCEPPAHAGAAQGIHRFPQAREPLIAGHRPHRK